MTLKIDSDRYIYKLEYYLLLPRVLEDIYLVSCSSCIPCKWSCHISILMHSNVKILKWWWRQFCKFGVGHHLYLHFCHGTLQKYSTLQVQTTAAHSALSVQAGSHVDASISCTDNRHSKQRGIYIPLSRDSPKSLQVADEVARMTAVVGTAGWPLSRVRQIRRAEARRWLAGI